MTPKSRSSNVINMCAVRIMERQLAKRNSRNVSDPRTGWLF